MTQMTNLALVGTLLVPFALGSFSGCASLPCASAASEEWTQRGVFEQFPPDGNHGVYSVESGGPPDFVQRFKNAVGREEGIRRSLTAHEDGTILWTASHSKGLDDDKSADVMRQTFADLGLPSPMPVDWDFDWGQAC